MGLLPLPCSAPVERCAHFGANDVPNSKEGKTRRTSRNACDSLSHTRAVVACRNYGRVDSWELQRPLFASSSLAAWKVPSLPCGLRAESRSSSFGCAPHGARKIQSRTGPLGKRGQRWSSPSTLLSQWCSEAQFTIKRWISVIWRLRHRGGVATGLPKMRRPRGRVRDLDSNLIARSARVRKVRTAARSGGDTVGRNRNPTNDRS